jgi:hypothetical protein
LVLGLALVSAVLALVLVQARVLARLTVQVPTTPSYPLLVLD